MPQKIIFKINSTWLIAVVCTLSLVAVSCQKTSLTHQLLNSGCISSLPDSVQPNHPKSLVIQALLDSITKEGMPGISMAVYDKTKGWFTGSAGYADIQQKKPFLPCQISRVGSTVKIVTAVSIYQLAEQGLINLDAKISDYLPQDILHGIKNADKATIRQILTHSSGIYNYILDAQFQLASLNDLEKVWQPMELLSYARNKDEYFVPGTDVQYSNTGYVLLGMLIEKVSGTNFPAYFKQHIFEALHLNHTRFNIQDPVPADLPRGYVDWYNTGKIFESTYYSGWDYYSADGGLQSNPYNLIMLTRGLFDGNLLTSSSLQKMLQTEPFSKEEDFFPIKHASGIFKIQTPYGEAWMHSGEAIGYFATILYFPAKDVTISWMTNGYYGSLEKLVSTKEAYKRILNVVLN